MGTIAEYINNPHEAEKELYDTFSKDAAYTFADIGACDGLDSIRYCKMFPLLERVWAFEPRQDNYENIVRNVREFNARQVHPVNIALSDRPGKMVFHSSYAEKDTEEWKIGNKSSSLLVPKAHLKEHDWCKFRRDTAMVDTLDNVMMGRPVDYIHIDVQGAELMVFKGGEKTLKTVRAIWIEVSNIYLYAGQVLKRDVEKYLSSRGFECIKDTCGNKKYGDMFWRRNK